MTYHFEDPRDAAAEQLRRYGGMVDDPHTTDHLRALETQQAADERRAGHEAVAAEYRRQGALNVLGPADRYADAEAASRVLQSKAAEQRGMHARQRGQVAPGPGKPDGTDLGRNLDGMIDGAYDGTDPDGYVRFTGFKPEFR